MKNSKTINSIFSGLIFLFLITLISCDKEEFDFTGDTTPRIFISSYYQGLNTARQDILHTPVGSFGNIETFFPVRSSEKASADVSVTCIIDNSLVGEYNLENGTDYIPVPAGLAMLNNSTLVIREGEYLSSDSLEITIADEALSQLTGSGYLVPLRINSVSADGDVKISSNLNSFFLVVATEWSNCYNDQSETEMVGTLIADRTAWSASIDVNLYSGSLTQLFDGSTNSYWQVRPPAAFNLVVDLAAETNSITGLRTNSRQTSYGFLQLKVYTSTDSLTWTYQGAPTLLTSSTYQFIRFYSPVTARYLKLELVQSRSTSRVYMSEFDVYRSEE